MRSKTERSKWPLTMGEASHIAQLPWYVGTHADIAKEYGVSEELIRQIREDKGYKGVNLA